MEVGRSSAGPADGGLTGKGLCLIMSFVRRNQKRPDPSVPGRVVALGERSRIAGLALVGVSIYPADDAEAVRALWLTLVPGASLVIVTPAAAEALGPKVVKGTRPLVAVLGR